MHGIFNRTRGRCTAALLVLLATAASPAPSARAQAPAAADGALADLPLVELPAAYTPHALAIVLSGDGGWRAIEVRIGETLARADVGVVGLDSLSYFWRAKTPERLARDLEEIVAHYGSAWRVTDVLLIGYSFGADVLPAAVNRMNAATRERIVQISLLGLTDEAAFQFHFVNWLGLASADARPVGPEAERLDMAKVQCIYGENETDSLCRDPIFDRAELIETRGGHHFDGDYEALAERLLDGYWRRTAS